MPDGQLTTNEVAVLVGVKPASIRRYVARGSFPRPDGHFGPLAWWTPETVGLWMANRPKRGRPPK